MPRFIINFLAFAMLQAAMVAALFLCFYDFRSDNAMFGTTVIKHRRLQEAASPRLILVAGSNFLFGIDSKLIEEHTKYSPVNMGMIASLRPQFLMDEIEASLRPGDLVVLGFEYSSLNSLYCNLQFVMGAATCRPANLMYLHWPQWRHILDSQGLRRLGLMYRLAWSEMVKYARSRFRDESKDDWKVVWRSKSLESVNEFGDLTLYHAKDAEIPDYLNDQKTLEKVRSGPLRENIARINAFASRCRDRGVRVVYVAPPVPASEYEKRRKAADSYERSLRRLLKVPILLSTRQMVYPDKEFIGKSYHLHGDAVTQRTMRLIKVIKKWEQQANVRRSRQSLAKP